MSPSSKPPFQYGLFLSYDHSDLELAKSVYARLSERLPVWWDNRSLSVGHSFPRKIEQAMEQSAAVLFLITANSARSLAQTTTWMRRELDMASVLETEREPPLQLMALRFGKVDMPLGLMRYTYKDCPGPDILDEVIDEIIASVQTPVQLRDTPQNGSAPSGTSLAQILSGATRSLTISGHTLDKICEAADVRRALNALIEKDVRVTLILLNPDCAYASAHEPFHLAESRTSAAQEIKSALHSLRSIFEYAGRSRNLEVFLSNYMPRFRTIILDDEVIYVHLYLYGHNVPAKHDFYLRRTEPDPQKALLFGAIVESTAQLLHSPDVIPYIRDGTLCERWTERHESTSFNWPPERRQRYQTIQHFYRDKCVDFHTKHGEDMEVYVQDFLKKTGEAALALDRTVLVLGCGTGKELSYLHKRGCEPWGVDFCSETIRLARKVHPELATQFLIEDYYNLHLMEAGRFSAIVANAALVHLLDRADMPEILRQLHRLLRAGGVAFLRMLNKDGVTEEFDAVLFRYPRWFVYFSLPDLEQLARDAGFEILRGSEHPHHNFDNVSWPCVLLKKLA